MTDFDADALIEERSKTHGDYLKNADITWQIKAALHQGVRYEEMHPAMKETLDMVAHKMHRIVNGDPWFNDHWVDMTGYPHLVVGNWDRLLEWHKTQERDSTLRIGLMTVAEAQEQRSRFETLRGLLQSELGVSVIEDGPSMRLSRGLTPAQEDMARAPRRPVSFYETNVAPLGASPEAAEPAPATLAPTGAAEGAGTVYKVGDRVHVTGDPRVGGVIKVYAQSEPRNTVYHIEYPTGEPAYVEVFSSELVHAREARAFAPEPYQRAADDGPVDYDPDDVPMPSQVRREPISATWAEYEHLSNQTIAHGPLAGKTWKSVYHGVPGESGRYDMIREYQEIYGR